MPWILNTDVDRDDAGGSEQIDVTTFTQGVVSDHAPWLNTHLTAYLAALSQMFETAYDLVVAQGNPDTPDLYDPSWSALLDPQECPTAFLPYLAQFVGAQVQPGTPDATARWQIVNLPAQHRGTPAALTAAAQTQLIGTKRTFLLERQDNLGNVDPYHAIFLFFQSELASVESNLINAVEAVKPAGIQITYAAITGFTWDLAQNNWDTDVMTWDQTSSTQP